MEQQGSYALMALYFQTLKFSATRILYCQGAMTSVLSVLRVLRSQFPRSWDLWYQASVPSNSYTHGPIYLDLIFSGSYAHSSKFPVSWGLIFSRTLAPESCFHVPMFTRVYISRCVIWPSWSHVLYGPMFSWSYVPWALHFQFPMFPELSVLALLFPPVLMA